MTPRMFAALFGIPRMLVGVINFNVRRRALGNVEVEALERGQEQLGQEGESTRRYAGQ